MPYYERNEETEVLSKSCNETQQHIIETLVGGRPDAPVLFESTERVPARGSQAARECE